MSLSLLLALVLAQGPLRDADRVVVVQNEDSPISCAVAQDYARWREVRNVVKIRCRDAARTAEAETTTFAVYRDSIEKPLRAFLAAHPRVDFIVLTKGVPIRIADAPGRGLGNARPALDSYLAALDYDKDPRSINIGIRDSGFTGTAWANHFWRSRERFTHAKFGGYLVTRLDGYTEADAKALTARALAAEKARPNGTVLLDTCKAFGYADRSLQPIELFAADVASGQTPPPLPDINFSHFNADMQKAADLLKARRVPCELDETDTFVGTRTGLMGYVSWGSNDKHYDASAYHSLRFAPGALGETAVSTSGRTFLPAQGGQSLVADLIAQGITGVKGYTDEPMLTAIASPSILFERYTSGWTLAESFYAASRFVGWEDVVIGDPLCRPYRAKR